MVQVATFYDGAAKTFREPHREAGDEELTTQTCIALASTLGLVPARDAPAVFATLVHDVMEVHSGHLNVGIIGVKELLPALVAGGRVDVALQVAQTPTQPGWVYMVLQGATTLWETWTGSRYTPVASWNHIMFGSQSAWYYEHLAGLQLAPGSRGWQRLLLKPAVWAGAATPPRSICANLSFASASIDTIRGRAAAAWQCGGVSRDSGTCADNIAERSTAHISCDTGTISAVAFASFGLPTGTCTAGAHHISPSCHTNGSKAVVEKVCLGKASCDVHVSTGAFHGDPCPNEAKHLSVAVTCSGAPTRPSKAALQLTYTVTIPPGSTASVVLPTFGAAADASSLFMTEGAAALWKGGTFVGGGVPGVVSAAAGEDAGGPHVRFEVGSGQYIFRVFAP